MRQQQQHGQIACSRCIRDVCRAFKTLPQRESLTLRGRLRLRQTFSGQPSRFQPGSSSLSSVDGHKTSISNGCSGSSREHYSPDETVLAINSAYMSYLLSILEFHGRAPVPFCGWLNPGEKSGPPTEFSPFHPWNGSCPLQTFPFSR